jgi:hypothetical protein
MKTRFADLGGRVLAGSPADFGKLIVAETEKWGTDRVFSPRDRIWSFATVAAHGERVLAACP